MRKAKRVGKKVPKVSTLKVIRHYGGKTTKAAVKLDGCGRGQSTSTRTSSALAVDAELEEAFASSSTGENSLPSTSATTQYRMKKDACVELWQQSRESLLRGYLEENRLPADEVCIGCDNKAVNARCRECGPSTYFCTDCLVELHSRRNRLHSLEQWLDGHFVPLKVVRRFDQVLTSHSSADCIKRSKTIVIIDDKGLQHLVSTTMCSCESEATSLIRLNFWPSSPKKPKVAFSFPFMELLQSLYLQCKVSVKEFCNAMANKYKWNTPKFVSGYYSSLINECFEEYRHFQYQLQHLTPFGEDVDNGSTCPACPAKNGGSLIECLDGCFGLVRKRSAGASSHPPRHGTLMFADQNHVDAYIASYNGTSSQKKDCNQFRSGEVDSALRSKGRLKLFDEKGIIGRVCRHDFPKGFINTKHGERIGYAVFEVERLMKSPSLSQSVQPMMMYDIACILKKHLQNNKRDDILTRVKFALGAFHAYGHTAACQVSYGPKWQEGFGLSDGEGLERLWSYLRGFSKITKEMTPSHRIDVLTDALLYYGNRVKSKLGQSLSTRMKRAIDVKDCASKDLDALLASFPGDISRDEVKSWAETERDLLGSKRREETVVTTPWDQDYVKALQKLDLIRSEIRKDSTLANAADLVKEFKQVEKSVKKMERDHGMNKRWQPSDNTYVAVIAKMQQERRVTVTKELRSLAFDRWFLLNLKKKYSDGQKIAIKLSKQINSQMTSIKKKITTYNAGVRILSGNEDNATQIELKNALDLNSTLYSDQPAQPEAQVVPRSLKQKSIDLLFSERKASEEITMLHQEMKNCTSYYASQIQSIAGYMDGITTNDDFAVGSLSLLKDHVCTLGDSLRSLTKAFSEYGVKDVKLTPLLESWLQVGIAWHEEGMTCPVSTEEEGEEEEEDESSDTGSEDGTDDDDDCVFADLSDEEMDL